jgi:hypothetical protein
VEFLFSFDEGKVISWREHDVSSEVEFMKQSSKIMGNEGRFASNAIVF